MNLPNVLLRNKATLKLLFIGALSLAMLIPLSMVHSIIEERQGLQQSAARTIAGRWGGVQLVSGLVAVTQQAVSVSGERGVKMGSEWHAQVLPELDISTTLVTEWRYLGIYQVPVYTTMVKIRGRVDWQRLNELQTDGDLQFWLPLGDVRGVREVSVLKVGELQIPAKPLSFAAGDHAGLQFTLPAGDRTRLAENYELELKLAGSESLLFLPLADNTRVALDSDWPHPEFIGQFLPAERSISDQGSQASWQLLGLNRPFADHWAFAEMSTHQLRMAGFGMRLETPVDGYQRSERSVKYGALFISLTFFTLFLFEVICDRPLHPVPYVLTGAALAVFYLLLLALSEYLSFTLAFLTASTALVLIISPYTGVVLGGRRRGALVGGMLASTFGLLYVLVSVQQAALLLGSLALLTSIAGLMYLTRRVNWFAHGGSDIESKAV